MIQGLTQYSADNIIETAMSQSELEVNIYSEDEFSNAELPDQLGFPRWWRNLFSVTKNYFTFVRTTVPLGYIYCEQGCQFKKKIM